MKMMTEGTPWKHILTFALPVLAGSLLQQLYNTADAIIVGRFAGEDALSAVGTTGSFAFFFLAVAIGFSSGNGVVVAQNYGAEDNEGVRRNASVGILFLMALGLASAVLGAALSYPAFKYLVGLIFQFGYNIFSAILRAVGDSAATLYFLLISSLTNIGLDILLVKVIPWGVAGAAIATVISQALSFVAAYIYMRVRYPLFRFSFSDYKWDSHLVKKTCVVGFPISLQLMVVSFGMTFIQRAVNGFGKVMTASFTVGQRIEMYLNLPCTAFQTTMATYTGQNVGAGKLDRIRTGLRQTLVISFLMTLVISACVWIFAPQIIELFKLSDEAAVYCLAHLKAVALINIVLSVYIPVFGVFQGTNHSLFPMIVACCALGTRVVMVYLLRYSPFLGHTIIWWNGIFGFGMGFIITWSFYLSGRWKRGLNI